MRKRSIIAAAGFAAATIAGALAPPATASAQQAPRIVDVFIEVIGTDAADTVEGLTLELWDLTVPGSPTLVTGDPCTSGLEDDGYAFAIGLGECDLDANGTYAIGLDGIPEGMTVSGGCQTSELTEQLPGSSFSFDVTPNTFMVQCDVLLVQPFLLVDKVVEDGEATPADFTIEVYDNEGTVVATGTDPSPDQCDGPDALANCAVIPLPAGDYQLGEIVARGYATSNVWCETGRPGDRQVEEVFPDEIGQFTLSDQEEGDPAAYCEVTNRYYEGDLVVTKSVTNDDGGTLGPADFTAEVYTEPDGSLVDSADCNADGECGSWTLPIGDYRIGEEGPQGYTPSVTCTVTGEPDGPGPITTEPPELILAEREAIPGDDAVATVEPFGEVTCEIVNDDPTTTTTTTMAPTTTDQGGGGAVPTTVAPILPPTGDSNGTMAIIATLLIAVGGALLVARRRTA